MRDAGRFALLNAILNARFSKVDRKSAYPRQPSRSMRRPRAAGGAPSPGISSLPHQATATLFWALSQMTVLPSR